MMSSPLNQPLRIKRGPDCVIARAFVEGWADQRDLPRFSQVLPFVAELRGSMVSSAEPPKARSARVRCAYGAVKPTVSVCDVYRR